MLDRDFRARLVRDRPAADPAGLDDSADHTPQLMLALHARRSAAAIRNWRAAYPLPPLMVVLNGTALCRSVPLCAATLPPTPARISR